jgi:hypothetical protein
MLKTFATIGLAAALAIPSASAFAVSGTSSSYGSDGYGPTIPTQCVVTAVWDTSNITSLNDRTSGARERAPPKPPAGGKGLAKACSRF